MLLWIKTESSIDTNLGGKVITYDYFKDGRAKYNEIKDNKTGLVISRVEYTYNDAFDYDNNGTADYGKITKTIKGDSNSPDVVSSTYTNKLDQLDKQERQHVVGSATKLYTDAFKYDYNGNKIEEKSARANDESFTEPWSTKFEYNYAGKVTKFYNIKCSWKR